MRRLRVRTRPLLVTILLLTLLVAACAAPTGGNPGDGAPTAAPETRTSEEGPSPSPTAEESSAVSPTASTAPAATEPGKELQKIRFGFATKAVSPIIINILLPEFLGYYADEGLTVESIPLGSNAATMAAVANGDVDFAVGVPSFQIPLVAEGQPLPAVNFYEYTYPFKWAVAVKPDSSYQRLEDLKGKTIGVANLGTTDYPIGQALFRLVGMDPEADVQWLAVGEGVTAGQALERGDIEALVYFDTGFGQIEAAGIQLRYLPLPENVPAVGGLYLSATPKMLEQHPDWAIGLARGVAKASLFIQHNPRAAAYGFIQMYPEAAPKAASLKEQIDAVVVPIQKRMPLYTHPDLDLWGEVNIREWEDEPAFLGLEGKISDMEQFYTNEFIEEINRFDEQAVIEQAESYVVPEE